MVYKGNFNLGYEYLLSGRFSVGAGIHYVSMEKTSRDPSNASLTPVRDNMESSTIIVCN